MGSSISGTGNTAVTSNPFTLPPHSKQAFFAAGCFWGVEHAFLRAFPPPTSGILHAHVGYMGGPASFPSPSYKQVCTGTTGHAEALRIIYDPEKVKYKQLVEFFYRMHDPTDAGGQGPDRGSQYRSVCWFDGGEGSGEGEVAREVKRRVGERWFKDKKVATELRDWKGEGERWWDAEEYHQRYLEKNKDGYECPSHFVRKFPTVLDTPIDGENGTEVSSGVKESEQAILSSKA
ncbi:peptide methionine sulfoxide reductase MsrA [Peziza echinospora]|nr:peptide methionine sulfoxide reductase MsrA [Peziza echinospora]